MEFLEAHGQSQLSRATPPPLAPRYATATLLANKTGTILPDCDGASAADDWRTTGSRADDG